MVSKRVICADCQRKCVREYHHIVPRCEGGTETIGLCRDCHVARHVKNNDWARWGQMGGKKTAQRPENWKRNLKQYQPKRTSPDLFEEPVTEFWL